MRYIRAFGSTVSIILCLVLLAACNGAAGSSGPRPTATFGPAVQTRLAEANRPRPTRTPTPEGQAAAPTATPTPRPTLPPTSTPAPDPADELLTAALLVEEDLGDGWWGDEPYVYEGGTATDEGMLRTPDTDAHCGFVVHDPYLNQVSGIYGETSSDLLVVQYIALYESDQTADLYLSDLIALMQKCPEFEETVDGEVELVRVSQLEHPEMGDRSAAFLIVSSGDDYQLESVLVGFRTGRAVTLILHMGEASLAGPVETWGTQAISTRAFEKIMSLKEQFDALERPSPSLV